MRVSMSAKKAPGAGSPITKRCAFVGHLMNAENAAAVIGLLAFIAVDHAGVSGDMIHNHCHIGNAANASPLLNQRGTIFVTNMRALTFRFGIHRPAIG